MTNDGVEARSCINKRTYMDRETAKKAAKRMRRRNGDASKTARLYRCPWCRLWHIGHSRRVG